MTRRDDVEPFLLSSFWGGSFLLIRVAGHEFPPVWAALLRSVFGAGVLLVRRARRVAFAPRAVWPVLTVLALVLLGVGLINRPARASGGAT